ncbi:MAG: AAA family ATPase [Magnetococcus sp. XQGC-1]
MRRLLCILLLLVFWWPGLLASAEPLPAQDLPSVPTPAAPGGGAQEALAQPDFPVLAVAVSPDGEWWATGGYQVVHLWARKEGRLQQTWRVSDGWIRQLAFSPDGRLLAIAGDDGVVQLWSWATGQAVQRLEEGGGAVYALAFSPDGQQLASGSADHLIRLWHVGTGQRIRQLSGHQAPVRGVAFTPDGGVLLSGAQDGVVMRWSLTEIAPVGRPFKGTRPGVHGVAVSPDGRWFAAAGFRAIHLWEGETGQVRPSLKKHETWVRALAFSADSSQLLSADDDGVLYLWQLATGRVLTRWSGDPSPLFSVAFIRENEWLSAGGEGRLLLWQEGVATPVWSLIGHGDGRWLSCRMVGQHRCWRSDDGEQLERLRSSTHAEPEPLSHTPGLSWTEMAALGVASLSLLLAFGKRGVLFLGGRCAGLLLAVRQGLPEVRMPVRPPAPARFARRLGGVLDLSAPNNRHLARICLPADFPLAITEFFYLRLHPGQPLERIPLFAEYFVRQAEGGESVEESQERPPLLLLVGADEEQTAALRQLSHQTDRLWVILDRGELTRLLLAAQPRQAFAWLLADHLQPALLSPYCLTGAVAKATLFFGRQPLLERLQQQGRRNHLLIAGQGMGKTSLLRALLRKYEHHPVLRVHLFAPEQADIATPLAGALECMIGTPLEQLLDELARFPERKKPILLIDDADAFVESDAARHFAVLERLSRFSDEGCCQTILAGSWGLHRLLQGSTPAPLAEWVDIHYLGPLETEACWQLVRKPMAWLQREWEAGVCLELIQASGGRPDWAMAWCHAVLRQLAPQEKTIAQHHLNAALLSRGVGERLDRWPELLSDVLEERWLDRMVVYGSVGMESFTAVELLGSLQKRHPTLLPTRAGRGGEEAAGNRLQQALERLEMASLLQRSEDRYYYASKLLRAHIMQQHPEERLKKALRGV